MPDAAIRYPERSEEVPLGCNPQNNRGISTSPAAPRNDALFWGIPTVALLPRNDVG